MKTAADAVKALVLEAMNISLELAAEDEARLGRKLTEAEARNIADMVERQLRTALALS